MLNWVGALSEEDLEKIQYRLSDPSTVDNVEINDKNFSNTIDSNVKDAITEYYENKLYGQANKETN